jgi:hypothetical protein
MSGGPSSTILAGPWITGIEKLSTWTKNALLVELHVRGARCPLFLGACCPNGRKAGFTAPILRRRSPHPVGRRWATTGGKSGGGRSAAALRQVDDNASTGNSSFPVGAFSCRYRTRPLDSMIGQLLLVGSRSLEISPAKLLAAGSGRKGSLLS